MAAAWLEGGEQMVAHVGSEPSTTVEQVRQVLVVLDAASHRGALERALERRSLDGRVHVHVLVPAVSVEPELEGWVRDEHLGPLPGEDPAFGLARARLQRCLWRLRAAGADVTGEVGDPDPVAAVRQASRSRRFDEILVSGSARGGARRIATRSPGRLRRVTGLPVVVVAAEVGRRRHRSSRRTRPAVRRLP